MGLAYELVEVQNWPRDSRYRLMRKVRVPVPELKQHEARSEEISIVGAVLRILPGFEWDGPSGGIDTPSFMLGALAHDALYALLRAGALPPSARKQADAVLYRLCRSAGMNPVRAYYVWAAVRLFGGKHVKPRGG